MLGAQSCGTGDALRAFEFHLMKCPFTVSGEQPVVADAIFICSWEMVH